jgi:seryl-tRNA synthetase
MLDPKRIRENPEEVARLISQKGYDGTLVERWIPVDAELQRVLREIEAVRAERNTVSKGPEAAVQGRALKERLEVLTAEQARLQPEYDELLLAMPNLPLPQVPVGATEDENVEIRRWGSPREFGFTPLPHWELGERLGLIDTERATKVSGTRFAYLKGRLVQLQFALVQLCLQTLSNEATLQRLIDERGIPTTAKPFIPVITPVFVRPEVMHRMARLEPRDERYHTAADDLYLVGSAEHTLGPMHMDETLDEASLPLRYIGYSTSFRREAGSAGRDTKGILRLHQFDKLEMESFTTAENSVAEQDLFVAIEEHLMQQLNLPYRVLDKCTADIGGPDARAFDVETWMPGQGVYRETHSADLMTDYQARRLQTRVKRTETGKSEFVHMNDATAFAIGRTLIAIMENYQQEDGTIAVPEVLVPLCGFTEIR